MVTKDKTKIDLFFINDPIYKFKINFLYGGTYESFRETIAGETGVKSESSPGRTMGCFWFSTEKDLYFLWLPKRFPSSTLGHEIIHILFTMFSIVGVPTDCHSQETFAYHWEWWFNKIKECAMLAKKPE